MRESMKTWQDNYIHVQGVMDEFVSLRERTKYLRDEVSNNYLFCLNYTFINRLNLCHFSGVNLCLSFQLGDEYEYKLSSLTSMAQ